MVKDADFSGRLGQFGHDPLKNSKSGRTKGNVPLYFWALNANCSNAIKVADFKFDIHVPRDTPDVTPLKLSEKGVHGQGRMTS